MEPFLLVGTAYLPLFASCSSPRMLVPILDHSTPWVLVVTTALLRPLGVSRCHSVHEGHGTL
jgi:hypothetical protein